MSGTGKKTALHKHLEAIASIRNIPFSIQIKNGPAVAAPEEGEEEQEAGQLSYESSFLHTGFDIARMSMQDKQKLRPILQNLGQGSQVLSGEQGRASRIIVLYHAHLLSSESILLIQACLEQNEGDVSIWMTSEMPVPLRIRDWFVEVPCTGEDRTFEKFEKIIDRVASTEAPAPPPASWNTIFTCLIHKWLNTPYPKIADIEKVKSFVYELLMRNLRWVEVTHHLMDALLQHTEISETQRLKCIEALAKCEATSSGYTIPSYRIPIIWEALFLQLRTILYRV
jgi:hypothetical protein